MTARTDLSSLDVHEEDVGLPWTGGIVRVGLGRTVKVQRHQVALKGTLPVLMNSQYIRPTELLPMRNSDLMIQVQAKFSC